MTREDFSTWQSPAKGTLGMNVGSHGYGADIDLTIAYGMRSPFSPCDLSLQWASFPDPKFAIEIADVFWRGSLVDRVDYAVVDCNELPETCRVTGVN